MKRSIDDPIERMVADALDACGLVYETNALASNGRRLDFYVPALDVFIECKQFSSDRIGGQIEGLNNVIVIQGRPAAYALWMLMRIAPA